MSWLNSTLAAMMPIFPKWMVKPFAKPYVAGEDLKTVLQHIKSLNTQGYDSTLDILGEHVQSIEEGDAVRTAYCELYDHLSSLGQRNTISLKLTHLGLELDPVQAEENLMIIVDKAKSHGLGLTIDMEDSPFTDITLALYRKAVQKYDKVGTVLQAYLRRSLDDLKKLDSNLFHLRICKGIYRESPTIAYQDREEIRENYLTMSKTLLHGKGYACFATHDIPLIDLLDTYVETENISKDKFEFQVLYGVPMGSRLEELRAKGYKVRVYVPFGEAWFEYAIRRLKENPSIMVYVLKNLFKR